LRISKKREASDYGKTDVFINIQLQQLIKQILNNWKALYNKRVRRYNHLQQLVKTVLEVQEARALILPHPYLWNPFCRTTDCEILSWGFQLYRQLKEVKFRLET
jgi:arsenate reductase-like glutaredoxin family protein